MHRLPCPSCPHQLDVSPAQAGEQTTCPKCGQAVDVPKLGELRQLPQAEASTARSTPPREQPVGRRIAFVGMGLVAAAMLLIAAFCTVRWAMIDVPMTTESHIADVRERYAQLSGAQLIREWEDMEAYGVALAAPFEYRKIELTKQGWGRDALISGSIGLAALAVMVILGFTGRSSRADHAKDT